MGGFLLHAGRIGGTDGFLRRCDPLLVFAAGALHLGDFQGVRLDFRLGRVDGGVQLPGAGLGLAGTALQALQSGLMQADVLLVGQSLHLLFRELTGDFFSFCRETSSAFPQSRQLCGVPDHLGFGIGLSLFCLSAGCLVLGHGGLLVRNFGFDVAGRLLVLGGSFRQAFQFQPGADVFGGGVHALALSTRQLGTEVIYLGLAGGPVPFRLRCAFLPAFSAGCAARPTPVCG